MIKSATAASAISVSPMNSRSGERPRGSDPGRRSVVVRLVLELFRREGHRNDAA
jgi:hypothetical protein